MRIKHFAGYGMVDAIRIKDNKHTLHIQVQGDHEQGIKIDETDTDRLYNWLIKKFDKTILDANAFYKMQPKIKCENNFEKSLELNKDVVDYYFDYGEKEIDLKNKDQVLDDIINKEVQRYPNGKIDKIEFMDVFRGVYDAIKEYNDEKNDFLNKELQKIDNTPLTRSDYDIKRKEIFQKYSDLKLDYKFNSYELRTKIFSIFVGNYITNKKNIPLQKAESIATELWYDFDLYSLTESDYFDSFSYDDMDNGNHPSKISNFLEIENVFLNNMVEKLVELYFSKSE